MTPGMAPLLSIFGLYGVGALAALARRPQRQVFAGALLGAAALMLALAAAGQALYGWRSFGVMQLWSWILFVGGPLFFLGSALLWRPGRGLCALAAALLVAAGVDGFLIEPHWLEISTVKLSSPKLTRPLRVALVADLQTDTPGDYERQALASMMAREPDLVLFAGDLVHLEPDAPYLGPRNVMWSILQEAGLDRASLGAYAVQGDVDRDEWWQTILENTGVSAQPGSRTLQLGEIALTLLSIDDSRAAKLPVTRTAAYHIVVGHSPDFAMAQPPADLLLAGHTHGGQVQLPFFGPLLTLTTVPRAWAAGHTTLPWGGDLIVSRGVGMERRDAPRVRFLCRPEIVIIELSPG